MLMKIDGKTAIAGGLLSKTRSLDTPYVMDIVVDYPPNMDTLKVSFNLWGDEETDGYDFKIISFEYGKKILDELDKHSQYDSEFFSDLVDIIVSDFIHTTHIPKFSTKIED